MKLSDMIADAKELLDKYGDIEIYTYDGRSGTNDECSGLSSEATVIVGGGYMENGPAGELPVGTKIAVLHVGN